MKGIFVILLLCILTAGCTRSSVQPVASTLQAEVTTTYPVPEKTVAVTAQRIDSTKIFITYRGSPDADRLIELETTVISSKGSVDIRSMGSRLDTTPVQIGGTDIFSGPYPVKVHILTTGYFVNGTHQDFLDTWI